MRHFQLRKIAFVCGCLIAGAANAAVPDESEAPVIRAGAVDIYPGFALVERHNDNLFRSDANKQSSFITVASPGVYMEAKSGANAYSLSYYADVGRYASSSTDNYDDHTLTAQAELAFSTRATLTLTPQYKIGHDDRGSTYSAGTSTPNIWHNRGVSGSFNYGSEGAMGRILVDAGVVETSYQNNRAVTLAFDRTQASLGGTFFYRLAPATYTFAQLSTTNFDYKDPASTLDGDEQRAMIGVEWKATAQTSGSFKIGQLWKNFDSAMRKDFTGTSWEGSVRWAPRSFVRLDLVTGRKPAESTGIGNLVWVTTHFADLSYDLSERTTLHLIASYLGEDFIQAGRKDETPSYSLKADYKLRKWLKLGAEYIRSVKSSSGWTGTSPEYHNNIYAVYLRSEL